MYLEKYFKAVIFNRKFNFSQNLRKLNKFESSNFNQKNITKHGACLGYVFITLKYFQEENDNLNSFYKNFEYNLKNKSETIKDVYFIMQLQDSIVNYYNKHLLNINYHIRNSKIKNILSKYNLSINEFCSYHALSNYLEMNELYWNYIGTVGEIKSIDNAYDEIINVYLMLANKKKSLSICINLSILFNDFNFHFKNNLSAHKIAIIFYIKYTRTTIIFFDPNEGLFEFITDNLSKDNNTKFKLFFISIMKDIYNAKIFSFEALTLEPQEFIRNKFKPIRKKPTFLMNIEERLQALEKALGKLK